VNTLGAYATDGNVVVWVDGGDNTVDQVSTPQGPKTVLASGTNANSPRVVAINGSNVLWFNYNGGTYQIGCVPLGGGTPQLWQPVTAGGMTIANFPAAVLNGGAFIGGNLDIYVASCGSGAVALGPSQPSGAGFALTQAASGYGVAGFGDVWISNGLGSGIGFSAIPVGGGTGASMQIANDGTYVYWPDGTQILKTSFAAPSTGSPVVNNTLTGASGLATDARYVYYAINGSSGPGIYSVPVSATGTATPKTLTTLSAASLTYASSALYFVSGGAIYKMATPL
jgi:hypothetical protein